MRGVLGYLNNCLIKRIEARNMFCKFNTTIVDWRKYSKNSIYFKSSKPWQTWNSTQHYYNNSRNKNAHIGTSINIVLCFNIKSLITHVLSVLITDSYYLLYFSLRSAVNGINEWGYCESVSVLTWSTRSL